MDRIEEVWGFFKRKEKHLSQIFRGVFFECNWALRGSENLRWKSSCVSIHATPLFE